MRRMISTVGAAVVLLAGCSSSGGSSGGSSAPGGGASSGSAQGAALAGKLRTATSGLRSAHVSVDAGSIGGSAVGDVSFADGQAAGSDITLRLGGTTRVITIGDTSYAKLPSGRNTTGKPWQVVSDSSKNEFVRALAGQVGIIKAAASLPAIADIVASATSVKDDGMAPQGHHYALQLDTSTLSGSLGKQLADLGTDPLPVDLYLDPKNRPSLITINAKLGTQPLPITVTASRYNAPVSVQAPPQNEVGS